MNIQENVLLAPYTTFHIGGPADYFITVSSKEAMQEAIMWSKEKNIPFFILGLGANILVGDKGFRGLIIKNEARKVSFHDTKLTAESGSVLSDLILLTVKSGLSGLEHFAGIPSSLGGALWQNLHFLSADRKTTVYIADILESAELLTEKGDILHVDKSYFHFAYDYSILHDRKDIVLEATLQLKRERKGDIQHTIEQNIDWRTQKHPKNAVEISAGSVFKKIESFGAGRLIEQAGLKGKTIGGAEISTVHANFIINSNHATAHDVRELIRLVQVEVEKKSGLYLHPEISFIGEF